VSDADDRARLRRAPVTVTGSVANIAVDGKTAPMNLITDYSITVVVYTARPPTAAASYQTDRTYSPLQVPANLQQTSINHDIGGRASDHLNRAVELLNGAGRRSS